MSVILVYIKKYFSIYKKDVYIKQKDIDSFLLLKVLRKRVVLEETQISLSGPTLKYLGLD